MKKNLLYAFFGLFLLAGCGGDDSEPVNNNQSNTDVDGTVLDPNCTAITGFTAVQDAGNLKFNISSPTTALYYEVSFQPTGNDDMPGNGLRFALSTATADKALSELTTQQGDFIIYVRSVCGDTSRSKWIGPKLVTIGAYCDTPQILSFDLYSGLRWDYPYSAAQTSNFQVQYGPQGFTLGNGTTATVNNSNFYDNAQLQANVAYDFYVRAYCTNNIGYGNWAGPYTYLAEDYVNVCKEPSNIVSTASTINNAYSSVDFVWKSNGEKKFETVIAYRNEPISSGVLNTIEYNAHVATGSISLTLPKSSSYDFYVRSVCKDGNMTQWVKKQIDL